MSFVRMTGGFLIIINKKPLCFAYAQHLPLKRGANFDKHQTKSISIFFYNTTVASKEMMIDRLSSMLDRGTIIIHDEDTLDELRNMIKKIKTRTDGSKTIRMQAKKGHHDDLVAALWIYAGSLNLSQVEGRTRSSWAIL